MWPDCDNATDLAQMLVPLEQWECTLPAHRDGEAIRAEMRLLAPDVIHAAELRLAGRRDEHHTHRLFWR